MLSQEKERERAERERRRLERQDGNMELDPEPAEMPTCTLFGHEFAIRTQLCEDASIEAPPSVLPLRHYCDITGLEAPYTDPATGLRYHDKSIYQVIKSLVRVSVLVGSVHLTVTFRAPALPRNICQVNGNQVSLMCSDFVHKLGV